MKTPTCWMLTVRVTFGDRQTYYATQAGAMRAVERLLGSARVEWHQHPDGETLYAHNVLTSYYIEPVYVGDE